MKQDNKQGMQREKMNKVIRTIIGMKYLFLELFAFLGFLFVILALTIKFIDVIYTPFLLNFGVVLKTLGSISFMFFFVVFLIYSTGKWLNTTRSFFESIRSIFEK